jgi:hypothetical protein
MKKIVSVLIVLILVFIGIGCTGDKSEYQNGSNSNAVQPAQPAPVATPEAVGLVILDSKLGKEEYGGYIVTGSAQSDKNQSYAEVNVKFYDSTGAVLQSGMTNIIDLKAGEKWNFKVYGPGSDLHVANYTIATTSNS